MLIFEKKFQGSSSDANLTTAAATAAVTACGQSMELKVTYQPFEQCHVTLLSADAVTLFLYKHSLLVNLKKKKILIFKHVGTLVALC